MRLNVGDKGSWPVFAATLGRALKKQHEAGTAVKGNHFEQDLILYHGLHGVNVKDFAQLIAGDGTFEMIWVGIHTQCF